MNLKSNHVNQQNIYLFKLVTNIMAGQKGNNSLDEIITNIYSSFVGDIPILNDEQPVFVRHLQRDFHLLKTLIRKHI